MAEMVPYKVFTTAHDRVVDAVDLIDPGATYETGLRPDAEAAELAADLPAGGEPVQVLVDMSGSNRGMERVIIGYVDLVARGLETAGVPFEVLGFTTSSWKGGKSAAEWKALGDCKPENPGRICDLLHVVFKARDAAWSVSPDGVAPSPAQALDRVYRPGMLKENVDGEAIRWAVSRLPDPAGAALLWVTDGAPCDDVTNARNHRDLLHDDRDRAVGEIEALGVSVTRIDVHGVDRVEDLDGEVVLAAKSSDPSRVARAALARVLEPANAPRP